MSEAILTGASGKLYRFFVMRPDAALLPEPAVYAFARPGPGSRRWTPVFLSRTANLAQRFSGHERWPEARLLGATHVLAWFAPDRALREAAEADLLAVVRPAMHISLAGIEGAPRADVAEIEQGAAAAG